MKNKRGRHLGFHSRSSNYFPIYLPSDLFQSYRARDRGAPASHLEDFISHVNNKRTNYFLQLLELIIIWQYQLNADCVAPESRSALGKCI